MLQIVLQTIYTFYYKFALVLLYNLPLSYSLFNISKYSTVGVTMASMNMDKQLDEQPPAKKQRIDNPEEEGEIANSNEAGLPKSAEMMGHKESESSTTIVDLPPSSRVPLPLELNCEIFKCLKLPVQRKFIWGLGRDVYGMFRQKLLKKTIRLRNSEGNYWHGCNKPITVSLDGSTVRNKTYKAANVLAFEGFAISAEHSRADNFPGTILYYYEVKHFGEFRIGLSNSAISDTCYPDFDSNPNNHAIVTGSISTDGRYYPCYITVDNDYHSYWNHCCIREKHHSLEELPEGAIGLEKRDVYGCGLVLDSEDKLALFFTANGMLIDQKIPISPSVDHLFPAVTLFSHASSIEANFGAKPFEYDIKKCPGLGWNGFELRG